MAGCLVGFNASAAAQERAVLNMTVVIPGDLGPERMPNATIIVQRSSDQRTVASMSTDSSGTAALTLPVGIYYVTASAPGFQEKTIHFEGLPGAASIVFPLLPRMSTDPLIPVAEPLPMTRAAISGRVVTLQGEPVPGAFVWAAGLRSTDQASAQTGQDGSFRTIVSMVASDPPQKFRLTISPPHTTPAEDIPVVSFVPDRVEFGPVTVSPGFETTGVEVRVTSHPEYRLIVRVHDVTGRVPADTEVTLSAVPRTVPGIQTTHSGIISTLPVRENGTVTFGPLPAGQVTIWTLTTGGSPRLGASTRIVIEDRPPDDVFLQLLPAARLTGRVVFSGVKQPPRGASPLRVLPFIPGHATPGFKSLDTSGVVHADGSFVIDGIIGDRCLRLDGRPDWTQRITLRGQDVTDTPLSFTPGDEVADLVLHVEPANAQRLPRLVCKLP
jgi:hypothetical protein